MIPLPTDRAVVIVNAVFADAPTNLPWPRTDLPCATGDPAGASEVLARGVEAPAGNPDVCPDCNGVGVLTLPDPFYGDYLDVACVCPFGRRWRTPTGLTPRPADGAVEGPTPPASIVAVGSLCVPARTLAGDHISHL